jgi:hypothetical protein
LCYNSLVVVAREFLYYATKALGEDVTPYIHIQGAHADQFQYILPYPVGRLIFFVYTSISIKLLLNCIFLFINNLHLKMI